ncbi:unnamed protein product [Peronospora belbahrii]|uniref:J domain-containing protein n=1 Tax=Peronospora belbahrii TaxID=622444 RepID=A0ABN8D1F9_9STRA|nr:unnamed protein product [Peronospora belbahrii]
MQCGSGVKDSILLSSRRVPSGGNHCGRNGGLFSSSSSSAENSDASDEDNEKYQRLDAIPPLLGAMVRSRSASSHPNVLPAADYKRRTMFSTSLTTLSSSNGMGDNGGHMIERKGLFEKDDDTGDSLETLQERVKLRQSKKQSEMKALRAQLETAQQRANDLEIRLSEANKLKEELLIRTKECQHVIEKRNKQLIKASERMVRHSDQYELRTAELQTRLKTVTVQCDQVRAEAATMKEDNMREWEMKEQEFRKEMEMWSKKHEKLLHAAESRLREQQAENTVLAKKLREVEQQLATAGKQKPTAVQVMASEEYQRLVKRCEDTEAVSRGLRFQLEKEQQEKACLFQQLAALQETLGAKTAASTVTFLNASSPEPIDDTDSCRDTTTTVVAEADVASFDITAGKSLNASSPGGTEVVFPVVVGSPTSVASSPSRRRVRGFSASSVTDDACKPLLREGKRRTVSAQMIEIVQDPPDKSTEDKGGNGKSIAASATFFEKLSSRFKRGSSLGNNSLNIYKAEDDGTDDTKVADEIGFASSLPLRQGFVHSKVLKDRPRMYVARSPSHHEDESSDSIFGSESSLSDISDDDTPPPPPPIFVHESPPSFPPPVHMESSSQLLFLDQSADADLSSSSSDEFGRYERRKAVESPIRLSKTAPTLETRGHTGSLSASQTPGGTSLPSSSSSSSSDDDFDEPDIERSQPLHVDVKKVECLSESLLSMSSSSSDEASGVCRASKMKAQGKIQKDSRSDQDNHGKRSLRSSTFLKSRENGRSLSGDIHKTSKSRMNEYMEARAKKRNEKVKRTQQKEHEETIKQEEYEKEWEKMAQEERERKRRQQQARRNGKRRPASMKTVRVSQMRQQMNNKLHQKDQKEASVPLPFHPNDQPRPHVDDGVDVDGRHCRRKSESKTSESEAEEERSPVLHSSSAASPPLPPEPTTADTELYLRQQARLRERHELQMKQKVEADEADAVRGDIHRRVEMWAFGKTLLHMILTLDQISSNDALKKCQLMVVQSPDDDTLRKAYRNIIRVVHPDKLRGATIPEQLEAKELFTVLNKAFEKFKHP